MEILQYMSETETKEDDKVKEEVAKLIEKADTLFDNAKYKEACQYYKKALDSSISHNFSDVVHINYGHSLW
jgi:hypothetical protein